MNQNSFIAIAQILAWGGSLDMVPQDERVTFGREVLASMSQYRNGLDRAIMEFKEGGRKIEAIKFYRQHTNVGLKESKDYVERLWGAS